MAEMVGAEESSERDSVKMPGRPIACFKLLQQVKRSEGGKKRSEASDN